MTTIGEEIDAWIKEYEQSDDEHKKVMRDIAAREYYKAKKIQIYLR